MTIISGNTCAITIHDSKKQQGCDGMVEVTKQKLDDMTGGGTIHNIASGIKGTYQGARDLGASRTKSVKASIMNGALFGVLGSKDGIVGSKAIREMVRANAKL